MKKLIPPTLFAALLLAGCSSAYRTGQTPDDVYYSSSPAVPAVRAEATTASENYAAGDEEYASYWGNSDDNYLRKKVQNGGKWNTIDDYDYWNGYSYNNGLTFNPYMYNYNYSAFNTYSPWGFNNFNNHWGFNRWGYNPMAAWGMNSFYGNGFGYGYGMGGFNNYWNNPGYYPVVVVKNPVYNNQGRPSLSGYRNNNYDRGYGNKRPAAQQPSQQNGLFRSVFGNNNGNSSSNSSNSSYERPARTFNTTPSSSSSSPASSGSSNSGSSRSSGSGSSSSGRGGRGG